jgi:hypothetical protein
MTTNKIPTLDPAAVAFFAEHAGTSYNPATETPEEGAERGARLFARAEAYAKAAGWTFTWRDDWELPHSHEQEFGEAYSGMPDGEPETCEGVTLYDENDDVLESLGCVDDADSNYRRVVEAELALEAMPMAMVCTHDDAELERLKVTCGACGATWCDSCAPAPSARCHFELEHDDADDDDDEPASMSDIAAALDAWDAAVESDARAMQDAGDELARIVREFAR